MRIFKIRNDTFKLEVLFVVNCSAKRFCKILKKYGVVYTTLEDLQLGTSLTFKCPPWRVIWTKNKDLDILVHEIFHLVTRICYDRGIPIIAHHQDGSNGDETAAYLLEFFIKKCLKELK